MTFNAALGPTWHTVARSAALCAFAAFAAACGAPNPAAPGDEIRSTRARLAVGAPAADLEQLTRDNAEFAARMHRLLASDRPTNNLVFSPHSISIALGMTFAGARTTSESQMAEALRFTMPQPRLHAAFNGLDQQLAMRASAAGERGGRPFRLRVANALFGQRGYPWQAPFLDTLSENYGAGLRALNFSSDPEAARVLINRWVADYTEQRIPELIQRGIITAQTTLVLTNAVYFNASWDAPFEPGMTASAAFNRESGGAVMVPTMNLRREMRYGENSGWKAVELLYSGQQVSMMLILPPEGPIGTFESELNEVRLRDLVGSLAARGVTLAMPKFRVRSPVGLKAALQRLGMNAPFEGGVADLSGMDGTRNLFIQDVVHEGFIAVDEAGTEAAAATAVVVGRTSAPEPATFTANRPFLFVIRDNPTGAVLFMGRVVDPSA